MALVTALAALIALQSCAGSGKTEVDVLDAVADDSQAADVAADTPAADASADWQTPDNGLYTDESAEDSSVIPWECAEDEDCNAQGPAPQCQTYACSDEHLCDTVPADDGTPCVPDNTCFEAGSCLAGTCVGEVEAPCDDGNPCTEDSCNPDDGACGTQPADGECDDGDACTQDDSCDAGECHGEPVECNDDNSCTQDACDPQSGCMFTTQDGECDDDNPCTTGDACLDGTCVGDDAGCECLVDDDCLGLQEDNGCVVAVACLTDEVPYECAIADELACEQPPLPCLEALCDPDTGECVVEPFNEGQECSLPLECIGDGLCLLGVCTGPPPACDDGNPCTADACVPGEGCSSVAQVVPCDDGDDCTINDFCNQAGECAGQDTACGEAPPLGIKLTSLVFVEPGFCLPAPGGECMDATALVNSFVDQDINSTDSPFVMLGLFEPFDLAGDSSQFFLGPGACEYDANELPITCSFTGNPTAMEPVQYQLEQPCVADPAPASPAPCFAIAGSDIDIGLMQIVVPVNQTHVTGTFVNMPEPDGVSSGEIVAFLNKTTADAIKVTLPLMPSYMLSELLDPAQLLTVDGKQGWQLVMHFAGSATDVQ